ncbi:MAG: permease [Verrucomicrobia bacterium]|nr:permease [Verrucomicrobiota bacterium]
MLSDFRFAFRTLGKTPGFTAVAVITLALAIGINSAVVALLNGLILRPVVPLHPEQVVNVFTARQDANRDYRQFSYAEFEALRNARETFTEVAAVQYSLAGVGRDDGVRRSFAFFTSDNFFPMMGVTPALGRFYNAEECRPNANHRVVVTSYSYWQRLGGKPDFVGSTLRVNNQLFTVIGVAPENFSGVNAIISPDLWLPLGVFAQFAGFDSLAMPDLTNPKNYTLNLTARMVPGLTLAGLNARLPALSNRLTAIQPADATGTRELQAQVPSRFSISTEPENASTGFLTVGLFSMAGCVLLIASINLANMLLARGAARSKEIALRLALGATRWRVIRQLLAEGLLLAFAGGALGLIISVWANDLLVQSISGLFSSMNFSLVIHMRPDAVVLAATFLFCLVATLMFSLGPALRSSRVDLVHDLKQQGGEPTANGRLNRFFAPRHCLVMVQIALSLTLLFSAGLFLRGAMKASGLALGFEPAGNLVVEMDYSLGASKPDAAKQSLFAVIDRARSLPGVQSVGVGTLLPYGNITNTSRVIPANAAPIGAKVDPKAPTPGFSGLFAGTTDGYFAAMGIPLVRGRDFTRNEAADKAAPRVAIVDTRLAQQLFPKGDALGQHIRFTQPPADGSPSEMEIVGICAEHRHDPIAARERGRLYVPYAQAPNADVFVHVKLATQDALATAAAVNPLRAALRSLDPELPVLQVTPYTNLVDKSIGLWIVRIGAVLFGVFGAIALLLAVVGVYGVKAFAVARRTREIGIRMALGAYPADVFSLVMKQGVQQTALAVLAGVVLSLGVGRLLANLLFEVSPTDPFAILASAALLTVSALAACYIPARRAMRISPVEALRAE